MSKVIAITVAVGGLLFASHSVSAEGELVFQKCQACHTKSADEAPKFGPPLSGIVGRHCGQVEGYLYSEGYSNACNQSKITWTEEEMHRFLDNPTKYLKSKGGGRSKMSFMLKDEAERAAVIEYLKTI